MKRLVPEGWHSVTARLVADDPARLVRFLKEAFEATGEFVASRPSIVRIGDSVIMVSGVGPRAATSSFLHLYVEDVDVTYRRAREAGATSLEDPREVPYGDRRAMVLDPFGNHWQIATLGSSAP